MVLLTLHILCCRATSWDSGVCLICYTMLYICCRSNRGRLFTSKSGVCCLGLGLYKDYSVHVVCYVSAVLCLFSGGGGGSTYMYLWWEGVLLMIFRVSSGGLLVWGHFG